MPNMGLFNKLGFGSSTEKLVEVPRRVTKVDVDTLSVHTANLSPDTDERLVIITTSAAALEELRQATNAVQLTGEANSRLVTFVPTRKSSAPVLDPRRGWIIPVLPATQEEIRSLPKGPGEYELTTQHLGLIFV